MLALSEGLATVTAHIGLTLLARAKAARVFRGLMVLVLGMDAQVTL